MIMITRLCLKTTYLLPLLLSFLLFTACPSVAFAEGDVAITDKTSTQQSRLKSFHSSRTEENQSIDTRSGQTVINKDGSEVSKNVTEVERKGIFSNTLKTSKSTTVQDKDGNRKTSSRAISQTTVGSTILTDETQSSGVSGKNAAGSAGAAVGYTTKRTEINGETTRLSVEGKGEATYNFGKGDDGDDASPQKKPVNASIKLYDTMEQKGHAEYESKDGNAVRLSENVDVSGSYSAQAMQTRRKKGGTVTIESDGTVKGEYVDQYEANVIKITTGGKVQGKAGGVKTTGEVKGEATVGGSGGYKADLVVGPDKIASKGEVDLFFGLKLSGEVSGTIDLKEHAGFAIKATLAGELSAGAGGKAGYDAELSWSGVKASAGLAAALGLGAGGKGAVEVDVSVLTLGVDLDKVGQQEKENDLISAIIRSVKDNEMTLPPGKKWSDILPELNEKAAWLAEHPEVLGKDQKGSEALMTSLNFQKWEEGAKSTASSCPDGSVLIALSSGKKRCMSCETLHGNFTALIEKGKTAPASSILDLSTRCDWAAGGRKTLNQARPCPANTVKLSDESGQNQCVPCGELQGDFIGAVESNNYGYAETLLSLAPNCAWIADGQDILNQAKPCPGNTAKLSDDGGQNQCVSCDVLYGDFNAALDSNDKGYAQTLLDLSSPCGWIAEGRTRIRNAGRCPDNTVKLSDDSGRNQCVPCDALYGDFNAAIGQGDTGYAETLVSLAGSCGWAGSAAQQMYSDNLQAELDQRCREQVLFSRAVISGDQYRCVCRDGLTIINRSGTSACQSCEQIRGELNSALQRKDINSAKGWMEGAQACGWYNEAVQVVAGIEQDNQQQKDQQLQDLMNGVKGLTGLLINEYDRNNKHNQRPPPPSRTGNPPTKQAPPSRKPPQTQSADGCAGGRCCSGHQLYCKQRGTEYSYPRTALDRNTDWVCDICGRPFKTKQGRLAPGLRGAQRGDVSCRH